MPDIILLEQQIAALEKENALLKERLVPSDKGDSVIVPAEMKDVFDAAQQTVKKYFQNLNLDPGTGTIEIGDERYILVRASALSKDFLDTVQNLYADRGEHEALIIGKNILFDIAHAIGMNDAKNFHTKMNLTDPLSKLSAGPVLFAHTGWAFVNISPESNPSPDENFYLFYDHPYSFEADSWLRSGKKSDTNICIMNCGYSSGWCEESFGIPLTAVEVSCTAKGDAQCTFIMSPPHKIQEHLERFQKSANKNYDKKELYEIPTFFERKRVEEEMRKSKILAEESSKSKADFVANMSHELRTPLGTILGFSDLMKKTQLDAIQKDYMEAISASGSSLLSIINNILDLSKIDAGKILIEHVSFNINDLLHAVKVMFSEKIKDAGLKLALLVDAEINYNLMGDPMRLRQILVNLVGNAVKFTEKGRIEVSCAVEDEGNEYVDLLFSVKDSGIGIPGEKIPAIFDRFMQADSNTTRRFGGTGLGLSITRQLISILGGEIQVRSEEGAGTEFYFTLHFDKFLLETKIDTNESIQPFACNTGKKILVVEDTVLNQKLTSIILKNNGFESSIASNGREAVQLLREQKFDLILMDIQMPEMDGYEATCIIREGLKIDTPIIAMTAHAFAGEKQKCFEQGVNDYLSKPFSENELLFRISALLKEEIVDKPTLPERITDLSFLKKQARNNEDMIEEMTRFFIAETPQTIKMLRHAIDKSLFEEICKIAHSLKTETSMFGLRPYVGEDLTNIEQLARESCDIDEIKKSFLNLESICEQAVKELSEPT